LVKDALDQKEIAVEVLKEVEAVLVDVMVAVGKDSREVYMVAVAVAVLDALFLELLAELELTELSA
jgi:hypothetical protein